MSDLQKHLSALASSAKAAKEAGDFDEADGLECAIDYMMNQAAFADEQSSEIHRLRAESFALRCIVSDTAHAIGNGAAASQESTIEFMQKIPAEIRLYTDRLRAELAEARRLLDEARNQEPVARVVFDDGPFNAVWRLDWLKPISEVGEGGLYAAAPMPAQPAVPDDVAKDAATKAYRIALDAALAFIGDVAPDASWWDDVWVEHERAILSATEGSKE